MSVVYLYIFCYQEPSNGIGTNQLIYPRKYCAFVRGSYVPGNVLDPKAIVTAVNKLSNFSTCLACVWERWAIRDTITNCILC